MGQSKSIETRRSYGNEFNIRCCIDNVACLSRFLAVEIPATGDSLLPAAATNAEAHQTSIETDSLKLDKGEFVTDDVAQHLELILDIRELAKGR